MSVKFKRLTANDMVVKAVIKNNQNRVIDVKYGHSMKKIRCGEKKSGLASEAVTRVL